MALTIETLDSGLKIVGPQPLAGEGGEALSDNFVLIDNIFQGSGTILIGITNNASGTFTLDNTTAGRLYQNVDSTAETIYELPVPSGSGNLGVNYLFAVEGAHAVTVSGDAGSTIQVGTVPSISGGVVTSSTNGSIIKLVSTQDDKWLTTLLMGTWNVETS